MASRKDQFSFNYVRKQIFIPHNKFLEIPWQYSNFYFIINVFFFPKRVTRPESGLIIEIGQLFLAALNNHVHPIRLPDWYWRVNLNWQTVRFLTAILTIISGAPEVYWQNITRKHFFFFPKNFVFTTKKPLTHPITVKTIALNVFIIYLVIIIIIIFCFIISIVKNWKAISIVRFPTIIHKKLYNYVL